MTGRVRMDSPAAREWRRCLSAAIARGDYPEARRLADLLAGVAAGDMRS